MTLARLVGQWSLARNGQLSGRTFETMDPARARRPTGRYHPERKPASRETTSNDMTVRPSAQLYVLFKYPELSQTFVTNEIHGLRQVGVDVDVISLEPGDDRHVNSDWAGPWRRLRRPRLRRACWDHVWFALRHPASYRAYLVAVARLRDHWRVALLRLPSEARRLRSTGRPGWCHTHFAWHNASVVVYLALLLDVPVSITVHARDIYVANRRHLRAQLGHFDRIVTVCNFNVGVLNALGVKPSHAVAVVPCGVDVPPEAHNGSAPQWVELVSVGRLVEKKGFDTLVRAIALVREVLPRVHVVIVGEGPERARLAQLIAGFGLEHNVTLAGALTHEQTLQLISGAKVFCLAAQRARDGDSDALPVVLREAMARGTAVVSTRVAGIPETIDEEVGWLVDPESPRQLADAVIEALRDDAERIERGRSARARVVRYWTIESQIAGMLRVFGRGDADTGVSDRGAQTRVAIRR
jgi:glycosyltransferase involved in cell wall biosynthesis